MHRLVFGLALALAILPLAAAPSATPSHPLSHIHPIDVDLNMSGQRIYNVSNVALQDGLNITEDGIAPGSYADVGYDALRWNDTGFRWEVQDANLSLENNEIQEFFSNQCDGGEVISQVYDNGSYRCQSITETSEDKFVNEAGDTMNGSLNFTDYADYSINNVSNINNFFAGDCSGDGVITEVNSDGTYNCTSTSVLNGVEDLAETLGAGNSAGNNNINMSGEEILNVENLNFSGGDDQTSGISIPDTNNGVLEIRDPNNGEGNELLVLNEGGEVDVKSGNLDLNDNNISNYWSNNLCGEDRAVKKIYENGTVSCTEQIEFTDNIENLSETLAAGNKANKSINLDENVIENIEALQDNSQDTIRFDGSDNIDVPNGNLNLTSEGNISDVNQIKSFFDSVCDSDGVVAGVDDDGTYTCVDPDAQVDDVWVNETGDNVTGDLDLNNNDLIEVDELRTNGTGSDVIAVRDTDNDNDIARFKEGGNLVVPSGNLNVSGGDIYITDGSNTNPSLRFSADSDTGIYREDANHLTIATEGIRAVTVNEKQDLTLNGNNVAGANSYRGINTEDLEIRANSNTDASNEQDTVIQSMNSATDSWVDGLRVVANSDSPEVRIPNGNLNLSDNNITDYWSNNLCGEDRAVKKIHENGTVECTQQIEFSDDIENLSETLTAGNVANQSIDMDSNNITDPGYVDGVEIDNPGTAIDINSNQYRVTPESISDTQVSDNSLSNSSVDSFSSFTLQDLELTNNLTGTAIVNSNQINNGAVGNNEIAVSSINTTQIQDDEVTGSDIASDSITKTGGQLDSTVAGAAISYLNGELNVSTDSTLTISSNDLGIADAGVDTVQIAESAVNNSKVAIDAINKSQLAQSGCSNNRVLEWTGSSWSCSNVDDLGTDDQNLSEVLVNGDQANQSIDMQDNNINDINQVNSDGQELEVGGNINATGNNVTQVSRVDFESGDSATGTEGGDLCLGDRC